MKRILLITSVLPWPLRKNGGAQRTALMKRALEAFGHVDIFAVGGLALRDEADAAFDQRLREQNVIAALVRQSPPLTPPIYLPGPFGKLWKTVRAYQGAYEADPAVAAELDRVMRENKYDLIVSRYLQPAMQAGVERYPGIPKLLDFDDIDWSTLATAMEEKPWPGLGGKIGSKMVLKTVRQACDGAMHLFGGVFVTSEEDRSLLTCDPIVLPNIPYSDSGTTLPALPPDDGSRELLFVGDLQFPPNRDGLDHFLSRVWPGVTKAVAAATITIVGRGLTEDRRARWANVPGVNVVGFAPDVAECYRRCAMSVVPIYTGGGT
ncbi:MAG TPA: glycosyltransferase family 4 protein, partial [Tepidisphaeraceae bacterium]